MKKGLSILLIILTVLSTFAFSLSAAAVPALVIDGKAYDNYYKVWWKYDSGAVKYNVYVDGKYDGVKKADSSKSYTFTTDPYTAGVKHVIQIKAVDKNDKVIATSNKITRYLAPLVPTLSYTGNTTGYTITAKVSSGTVHGFALYKYNASKDKYEFYKNFKKSITINRGNTKFKDTYRAKAYVTYSKTYYSQLSGYITCVPKMEKITLKSASSPDVGKITLKWTAASGSFTGYQIQYTTYDSFDVFRVYGVAKKYTSYTLNLIPGICYKLRVRTYKDVSGGRVYGSWSGVKTLYTKPRVGATPNTKYLLNYKVKVSKPGSTGCARLNNALDRILKKIGCGSDSKYYLYDKVRFAYRYIATEQFKKNGSLGAKGSSSYSTYSEGAVLRMLENYGSTGSCYEYNYLFHYLCLRMGLKNTYMVDGMVSASGGGRTGHWWMMMKIAGNNYYFDPRMQRYMSDNTALNFYCLPLNGSNRYSDYFRFYDAKAELK
ncbi:MAG: fibronectin type III domain-containing protein [Clostridia bacterium]|nr:fibronectin type III domain-containing protein [Clostridia bacterium]